MLPISWNSTPIKNKLTKHNVLSTVLFKDEPTLQAFSQDFGNIFSSTPTAVGFPTSTFLIQELLSFAYQNNLPITLRGNGWSQCGQSLAYDNSLILQMTHFKQVLEVKNEMLWAEANASWSHVVKESLKQQKIPYVVPYNCNLTLAGVLSAGGIGASSFLYGGVVDHIQALEVITTQGEQLLLDKSSPLFHACLGGQGQFALITKVGLKLRECKPKVRTFFLLYLDRNQWIKDLDGSQYQVDYIECFCTPAMQGAKLTDQGRIPFAQWFYALHLSIEYDEHLPELNPALNPWQVLHTQEEEIEAFMHRHDGRFLGMQKAGLWDLCHPWYECFTNQDYLEENLAKILPTLPLYYATVLQIVPIKPQQAEHFFMLPESQKVAGLTILNPGLVEALVPPCVDTIKKLDDLLLKQGGKRYLSGYLGENLAKDYWQRHFGDQFSQWERLKKDWDPRGILCSALHHGWRV